MRPLPDIERDANDRSIRLLDGSRAMSREAAARLLADIPDLIATVRARDATIARLVEAMTAYRAWVTSDAVKRATTAANIHGMGITEREWLTQGKPAVTLFDEVLAMARAAVEAAGGEAGKP